MSWNARLSAPGLVQLYAALRTIRDSGHILRTSALFHSRLTGFVVDLQYSGSVVTHKLSTDVTLTTSCDVLPASFIPVLASATRVLELRRKTLVMGILNVTPDSFSDGGRYLAPEAAHQQAVRLVSEGADILDIGAESTRPGSEPLDISTELSRLMPVLTRIRSDPRLKDIWISIDTTKPEVATAAITAGADMINDVSFGKAASAAKEVPYVLMHSRGTPKTMRNLTTYPDGVVSGVLMEMREKVKSLCLWDFNLVLDPGVGFAKTQEQSWTLVRSLRELRTALPYPWLLGHSNKSFMRGLDLPTANLAVAGAGVYAGVDFIRVHSVSDTVHYLKAADKCWRQNN